MDTTIVVLFELIIHIVHVGSLVSCFPQAKAQCKQPARRDRRGGGGCWRAYVREASTGTIGRADLQELAVAYRLLSEADTLRLRQLGAAGTRVHRVGGSAFGVPFRFVRAQQDKHLAKQVVEKLHGMDVSDRSHEICKKFDGSQASLNQCMKFVRQCHRLDFQVMNAEAMRLEKSLAEFEEKRAGEALKSLREHVPELAGIQLQAIPCARGLYGGSL